MNKITKEELIVEIIQNLSETEKIVYLTFYFENMKEEYLHNLLGLER